MDDRINSISALQQKKEMGKVYDFSTSWLAFAYRLAKNEFFIAKKLEHQNYICKVCNVNLKDKFHLHHITYDHYCELKKYLVNNHNDKKSSKIPDCKFCFENNLEFFKNCNTKTEIVHKACHGKLHNKIKSKAYSVISTIAEELLIESFSRGKKWTTEETEKFIQMANNRTAIEEMCKTLGRNRGGIVARIKKYGFEEIYLNKSIL